MKQIFLIYFLLIPLAYSDYFSHPGSKEIIDELIETYNFDEEYVNQVFKNASKQQKIIDSISTPAEFTWTWDRYKKLFIEDKRIKNGKKFIQDNLNSLERAEEEFGVPKEIIVSILGIETRYGKIMGNYRVIDSLMTLGFDYPRRADFFKDELIKFFLLTRENDLNIYEIKGSYAGAMGYGQFIPSSYRSYAIDFDNDGIRNIVTNPVDAIGSVANYLSKHGWEKNALIAEALERNDVTSDFKTSLTLKDKDALELVSKSNLFDKKYLQINFEDSEFWLGHKNLYVLSRYNRSSFYVMAVFLLSQEINYAFEVKL